MLLIERKPLAFHARRASHFLPNVFSCTLDHVGADKPVLKRER